MQAAGMGRYPLKNNNTIMICSTYFDVQIIMSVSQDWEYVNLISHVLLHLGVGKFYLALGLFPVTGRFIQFLIVQRSFFTTFVQKSQVFFFEPTVVDSGGGEYSDLDSAIGRTQMAGFTSHSWAACDW